MKAVALGLWLVPVAALWLIAPESVFTAIALFFSKLAMLTFGGAYPVLAQAAVTDCGWLRATEMLDGPSMAETAPGLLIMALQFVGFMAAFRSAGWEAPLIAGTLGGLLATWVTLSPCFTWIFLGAPFLERLRANRLLSAALAAAVGVIANLALWFALNLLWRGVERINLASVSLDLPQIRLCLEGGGTCLRAASEPFKARFLKQRGQGASARGAVTGFPNRRPCASGSVPPRAWPKAASARFARRAAQSGS